MRTVPDAAEGDGTKRAAAAALVPRLRVRLGQVLAVAKEPAAAVKSKKAGPEGSLAGPRSALAGTVVTASSSLSNGSVKPIASKISRSVRVARYKPGVSMVK